MKLTFENLTEPGLAVDAVKILINKLNPENTWLQSQVLPTSYHEDEAYVKNQLKLFPDPDKKLYLFVYISKTNSSCYLTRSLRKQLEGNFDDFSFQDFITSFNDISLVTKNLLAHYTGVLDYSTVDFETLIRNDESIPDKIKVLIYGFLLKPESYIEALKKYLCLNYDILIKTDRNLLKTSLDASKLKLLLKSCIKDSDTFLSGLDDPKIRYSICTTIPYQLQFSRTSYLWLILTEKSIELFHSNTDSFPSDYLIFLGDALRNHTRLSIIQQLICTHSINISDIEQATKHATATIHHHISILKRARLINEQKCGKQTFYSLNPEGLLYATKTLSDIIKEWNKHEKMA